MAAKRSNRIHSNISMGCLNRFQYGASRDTASNGNRARCLFVRRRCPIASRLGQNPDGPRLRVWSRRIGERLERRDVAETFEAGSIVVVHEAVEESIAVGVGDKEAVSDAAFRLATDGLDDATVEAFDEAVGLRAVRFGEAMINSMFGADAIEGMAPGRPVVGLVLHVDGEAIGKLAAVVGKDGVNPMREVGEEATEEASRGVGVAAGMNFQIDIAGGPIDGDEGVALAFFQGRQVLEIDMDEADGRRLEHADQGLVGAGAAVEAVPHQTAMDG